MDDTKEFRKMVFTLPDEFWGEYCRLLFPNLRSMDLPFVIHGFLKDGHPRLDQLVWMVEDIGVDWNMNYYHKPAVMSKRYRMICPQYAFIDFHYGETYEQALLAFICFEKWGLRWKGGEWE